jgi:3-methyladenine DNA glycosylase/8-oxoguanine DNA glycosylase
MTQAAANIMARSLENLATRHEPPTINEATRAADILKTLDNILRLDEGKPTDIVENTEKPLDDKELKKKLSKDPFSNIILEEEEDDPKTIN